MAHGFARLWCEDCAHDYLVAFSCKGRAVCPCGGGTGEGASGSVLPGNAGGRGVVAMVVQAPAPEPHRRFPAHYLWAVPIARIYEVFPLVCPLCGANMRILAFVTEGVQIRRILEHIGVDAQAPPIAPARGPPLWDECDAQGADGAGQGAPIDPDWGLCRARHRPHPRDFAFSDTIRFLL